jgi:hypothetical protein
MRRRVNSSKAALSSFFARGSLSSLFGLSGVSGLFRSLNQTIQRNQINQKDQMSQISTTRREMVPAHSLSSGNLRRDHHVGQSIG